MKTFLLASAVIVQLPPPSRTSPSFLYPAIVFSLFFLGSELKNLFLFPWCILTLSAEQVRASSRRNPSVPFFSLQLTSLPSLPQVNPSLNKNKREKTPPRPFAEGLLSPSLVFLSPHSPAPAAVHRGGTVVSELNSDKLNIFFSGVNFSRGLQVHRIV